MARGARHTHHLPAHQTVDNGRLADIRKTLEKKDQKGSVVCFSAGTLLVLMSVIKIGGGGGEVGHRPIKPTVRTPSL